MNMANANPSGPGRTGTAPEDGYKRDAIYHGGDVAARAKARKAREADSGPSKPTQGSEAASESGMKYTYEPPNPVEGDTLEEI